MQPTSTPSSALVALQASRGLDGAARLNDDILRMVFSHAFPANPALLVVCKLWTEILLDHASLWTVVDSPSKQVFFERSKQMPLDIVGVDVGRHALWWDAVIANRHRVRRLEVVVDGRSHPRLDDYAPEGRVPDRLEQLAFCSRRGVRYHATVPRWATSARLSSLSLFDILVPSLELINPLRLTELNLSCSFYDPITLADVWSHVSLCRHLRRLRLHATGDVGEWPPLQSTLLSLREAHLGFYLPRLLPAALEMLPPNLDAFRVDMDPNSHQAFDAVARYFRYRVEPYRGLLHVSLRSRPDLHRIEYSAVLSPPNGPVAFTYEMTWKAASNSALPGNVWRLLDCAETVEVQDIERFAGLVHDVYCSGVTHPLGDGHVHCLPHLTVLRILAPSGSVDSEDAAWAVSGNDLGPTQQRLFPSLRRLEIKHVLPVSGLQHLVNPAQGFVWAKVFDLLGIRAPLERI